MKAYRDKTTGKLTIKVKKDEDSPESKFGKELQKRSLDKKNEQFSKDKKIERGLNNNMSTQSDKQGTMVSDRKKVFDN